VFEAVDVILTIYVPYDAPLPNMVDEFIFFMLLDHPLLARISTYLQGYSGVVCARRWLCSGVYASVAGSME
jgi:hypothetical protein